jgi:hypothetical protein
VEDKPKIIVEAEGDAFSDATEFADGVAFGLRDWRLSRAK